jgi:hypothetical protein
MEQKQRRVKANPFGEQAEDEVDSLPAPPAIDDLIKAAEMAADEQRRAQEEAAREADKAKRIPWDFNDLEQLAGSAAADLAEKMGEFDPRVKQRAKFLWDKGYICHCMAEGCPIGYFVLRSSVGR